VLVVKKGYIPMSVRIVSLIPSATEIVDSLGLTEFLVGRSHECDFPAQVLNLPILTAPKFDPHMDSRAIQNAVSQILQNALSVYRVDEALLQTLQATHIITQAQCEVCAVSLKDVEEAVCRLSDSARVVSLEPNQLADVWADIQRVASALGEPSRGERLLKTLQDRIQAIASQTALLKGRPRVACIEWIEPLMAAGNWMPELVDLAGGQNLFGVAGQHSPWMSWDDLRAANPDILVLLPCGFDIARTCQDMHFLTTRPDWDELSAVQSGRVYLTDGNQFFNRPGPRLVESLEILAEIFHPDMFDFGHRGRGWVPWSL
jgi:iron complex transport system substrate-binding protein